MERFLERVSVSEYRNNFILKGGMLVASIVGVDMRATMDIDTTVKALPLNEKDARAIIERIGELQLEDGVNFNIIRQEFSFLCKWEMNCKKNIENTCSAHENMV